MGSHQTALLAGVTPLLPISEKLPAVYMQCQVLLVVAVGWYLHDC
jgi:hypothetical protein